MNKTPENEKPNGELSNAGMLRLLNDLLTNEQKENAKRREMLKIIVRLAKCGI